MDKYSPPIQTTHHHSVLTNIFFPFIRTDYLFYDMKILLLILATLALVRALPSEGDRDTEMAIFDSSEPRIAETDEIGEATYEVVSTEEASDGMALHKRQGDLRFCHFGCTGYNLRGTCYLVCCLVSFSPFNMLLDVQNAYERGCRRYTLAAILHLPPGRILSPG